MPYQQLSKCAGDRHVDERRAGQLMLALYRCGRQADALEHYRCTRARLADELGIDPGSAPWLIHQRILTADPALDIAEPDSGPTAVSPAQLPLTVAGFTGRHDELTHLDGCLADISAEAAGEGTRRGASVGVVLVLARRGWERRRWPCGGRTGSHTGSPMDSCM
jgi:hypothetical protein